jgi:uncharacterized membrane protein YfcA
MNIGTELWLFAVSLGASALGGMLGMASGIFIVPVLAGAIPASYLFFIFGMILLLSALILLSRRHSLRPAARRRGDWVRVTRIAHSAATSPIGWSACR